MQVWLGLIGIAICFAVGIWCIIEILMRSEIVEPFQSDSSGFRVEND